MSVSVQVNDAMHGRPATGISVRLHRDVAGIWVEEARATADDGGLVSRWRDSRLPRGVYQLEIDLDGYLASLGTISLYPAIIIRFRILDPDCAQHISLLVTSSSYFTYQQADIRTGPRAVVENGPAEKGDGGGYV
jgi:5-hydroxyisourate hydrolase-like protein (transthyretin family)